MLDGSTVAINQVNHLTNSQWFQNNTTALPMSPVDTAHIEYDGFTIPLTAKVEVTPTSDVSPKDSHNGCL